jgi:chromate transporter
MQQPEFRTAFIFWLKLGFISFGGPAGQIAIMHAYLVEKMKWVSNQRFMHALNYCMLLPGPEAQQLATYIGWLLHGVRGGLVAGILFVLPSMFILLGLSIAYVSYADIPWVYAMFNGLKPTVVAIIILALIKIGKKSLVSALHFIVAVLAFVSLFIWDVPFPIVIAGALVLAAVWYFFSGAKMQTQLSQAGSENEQNYYINATSFEKSESSIPINIAGKIILFLLIGIIPYLIFWIASPELNFWRDLIVFFTQAAFVTFGGAYAVLPYVAQVSVEKYQWLSEWQMMDGLALGETTPGPLIMVLAFVGFMAGYNHFNFSLLMGATGMIVTTFYTFMPCFLFIFLGAPIIERTRTNPKITYAMSLITAAVVGVILNLALYLGEAIVYLGKPDLLHPDWIVIFWILISLFAMHNLKVSMIKWILISALFGLAFAFL